VCSDRRDPETRRKYFQTARGTLLESDPIYEGARIFTKTHVQIAVRNPYCILGYFRPSGGHDVEEEAP